MAALDPEDPLAGALDAAERGAWTEVLGVLLAAWRAVRAPELAALIDRVSARAAGPPVTGGGSTSARLRRRIATAGDADVAPILELALRQIRTFPRAYLFVLQLAKARAPDPRIAAALAQVIARPPFVDRDGALYPDVVVALDRIDDPRFRGVLVEAWRALEPQRGRIRKYRDALDVLKRVAASIGRRPEPPALPPAFAAGIARLDTALVRSAPRARAADPDELLAAVRADPADVHLRLVYADALQERGDPRGELIALQCGRADGDPASARERELLATHARAWLGELEPIVMKQGLVFRRGFLACAREHLKKTEHAPLLGSPEWTTIEQLDITTFGERAVAFATDPRWTQLRGVYGLHNDDALAIGARAEPLPWTALGLVFSAPSVWIGIERALPALVELDLAHLYHPLPHLQELASRPLGERLRRIRVSTRYAPVRDLLAAARRLRAVELELVPAYTFPGAPEGAAVRFAGDRVTLVHHDARISTAYAALVLGALPPGTVRSIALEAAPRARVDDDAWAGLARVLQPHGLALERPAPAVSPRRAARSPVRR